MERLEVRVEHDHLERLVKSPLAGVAELIWNSLDADAANVRVEVLPNDLGGVDQIDVIDDGSGITPERARTYFSQLGGSWKKYAATTDRGRVLHGRAGQGRWAAFGLGRIVVWDSVAERISGETVHLSIAGMRESLHQFDVTELDDVDENMEKGTTVRVSNLTDGAKRLIDEPDTIESLASIFALYLSKYPVQLFWRSSLIDPAVMRVRTWTTPLTVDGISDIELTVIEWKNEVRRSLHFCDGSGVSFLEISPGIQAPGFQFTAYISWDGFREHVSELALADLGSEPVSTIVDAARDALRSYFKDRLNERGTELVQAWKADNTYPYVGEPESQVERAERDLFEILAVAAAPVVEPADPKSRKLSLRLLREGIEQNPSNVHEVIGEVLDLPEDQLEDLSRLLERTSLSAIIAAAHKITDRLDFIQGLEKIVFDRGLREHVLERSQLHRILANETWLFREEYALTADDVTLRTALSQHIGLLGRDELSPEEVDSSEVLDENERRVVVDMMLSRLVEQRHNEREHIVIELKRPTKHIGMTEFSQIMNYANAVVRDDRFAKVNTRWEFWIVGDHLDSSVELMANQRDREAGVVVENDAGFTVRARTWAEVIADARHRLKFVKESLDYVSADDAGMKYLRRVHGQYLPPVTE